MLAIGDTAHVGFRVFAFVRGRDESFVTWLGQRTSLIGIGEMVSSITMTFFYVFTLDAWRVRFGKTWNWFSKMLLACAFYTPVVLFGRRSPLVGLLMIPKTIAYVAMALRTYRDFYRRPRPGSGTSV
ncbi:hypothetical protein [Rhodococcus sp. NPDC059234]|uniref:hypothetical protein n=1 Tax=Rhodococcus sp. NPDC059234 TaxID=3346781 RepID=UPI0036733077